MEYIEGADIGKYLFEYNEIDHLFTDDPTPDQLFIQLIDAFCCIEANGIIHRDIRESNIMVDNSGMIKVIDFGIGKIVDKNTQQDSLVYVVNRANADTLPDEYYSGEYTILTDMYYLAELLNRLMRTANNPDDILFSYQAILNKMMEKNPDNRYASFAEIREAIGKHDFTSMTIMEEDKATYQEFVHFIYNSINHYNSSPKFNANPELFLERLHKVLEDNLFEYYIQNNNDLINSIVLCSYSYSSRNRIECDTVKRFYDWFLQSTKESQKLIISNIISKLSKIKYDKINDDDIPF